MDKITINSSTYTYKMRKFKRASAETAWLAKFSYPLKIEKIWKHSCYFLSPRDTLQFWKVRHRTLYVRKHDKTTSGKCAACTAAENIEHLIDCPVIHAEFWSEVLSTLRHFEFPPADDTRALLLLGMTSAEKPAPPEVYGFITLAWRALYAELTRAHIEKKSPNLQNAFSRACLLTHTRLTAYGHGWTTWHNKNLLTSRTSSVPVTIQKKHKFIEIDVNAQYAVDPYFITKAKNRNEDR